MPLKQKCGGQRPPLQHDFFRASKPWVAPVPSPAPRERGAEGGLRAIEPRACALGYSMPPLSGLLGTVEHKNDFVNDFPTHDTSCASITPDQDNCRSESGMEQ